MFLKILGMNHRTAPVELREQVAFESSTLITALAELGSLAGVQECVIVSTCNRTEIYFAGEEDSVKNLTQWLSEKRALDADSIACLYALEERKAIEHAFLVASGLDSMVLGEPQILGQMKEAYRLATASNSVGPMLNRLFQHTFAVAKQVRTQTEIGANAVSIAYAAVQLAKQVFSNFKKHTALLLGAGETIELAARHLSGQDLGRMIIANRSIQRARDLASKFGAYAIDLKAIPDHLAEADIVICSTASPEPILSYSLVAKAALARKHRPVLVIDIAVPRDVEPKVSELEDVYLYTVDDLTAVIEQNVKSREKAASDAKDIVRDEVDRFLLNLRTLDAVPVIRQVREKADFFRDNALEQARRQLEAGKDPSEVLETIANILTNKLMHAPSTALRQAGEEGDTEMLRVAQKLFNLDNDKRDS